MKKIKTTAEVKVPKKLIDQIIGQEKAVAIVKKAAKQRRNVLLIGTPGTGKSMMAQAMAELMTAEDLEDVLIYPNQVNENQPLVRTVRTYPTFEHLSKNRGLMRFYSPKELAFLKKYGEKSAKKLHAGLGRRIANFKKQKSDERRINPMIIIAIIGAALLAIAFFAEIEDTIKWFIIAVVLGLGFLYVLSNATAGLGKRLMPTESKQPKLLIDNTEKPTAPFIDATGSRAGSLLGDIKHDPLQSGGLGTPAHVRVEAGAIHQASKGVLFIDEIASLKLNWQQEILTAMQEKKYSITGQSEMSSGALVKTQPVPTDFVLVAAGNLPDMQNIHPALRSRIRGGGYEIFVEDSMEDGSENEEKLVQFVAQEIIRDGKIPHFDHGAVEEIIEEARRMSGRRKRFTLNLRELGGLVRAAGDVARENNIDLVTKKEVNEAKKIFRSIESQLGSKMIERKKEYQTISVKGAEVGRVNGLAVLGNSMAGLVLPIVAEATPASSKSEGRVIATGKLGVIAKEAVDNVSAIFKKYIGNAIVGKDLHIQFLQTYEGVEGDSASISIAVAVISALSNIPVLQNVAMTGSLDVRGRVLPVGGINGKIEAAIESGITKVLIPKANSRDVILKKKTIEIVEVENIADVLGQALKDCVAKKKLLKKMKSKT
jgi:Lon-like ATP-dependent protease